MGYTGGINLADEYINEYEKYGHWKDIGIYGSNVRYAYNKFFTAGYSLGCSAFCTDAVKYGGFRMGTERIYHGFHYSGTLIYIMAMYIFFVTVQSAINVVKYRKYNSPVMSASRVICLTSALVSMLSLETAMLSEFGHSYHYHVNLYD